MLAGPGTTIGREGELEPGIIEHQHRRHQQPQRLPGELDEARLGRREHEIALHVPQLGPVSVDLRGLVPQPCAP